MSDYLENAEVKMMSAIENLESNLRYDSYRTCQCADVGSCTGGLLRITNTD